MTIVEILADVVERLEQLGIEYAVGGSLASSTWGQMRQANNADIAVMLTASHIAPLVAEFGDAYLVSDGDLEAALLDSEPFASAQLLHMAELFKIDLFLLRDDPFGGCELDRAVEIEIAPNKRVRICSPEDIVLCNLRWFVRGERTSDVQWNDIVQVLEVQRGLLDEEYLDRWALHFGVTDLLNEARAQAFA